MITNIEVQDLFQGLAVPPSGNGAAPAPVAYAAPVALAAPEAFAAPSHADLSGSHNFGVVTVKYTVDPVRTEVRVEVLVAGISITKTVLNVGRGTLRVPVELPFAKADVKIAVDFNKTQITYDVKACTRVFADWQCTGFKGILFNW